MFFTAKLVERRVLDLLGVGVGPEAARELLGRGAAGPGTEVGARAHREAMRNRRTPAPAQHRARRPGAPRTAEQPCLTPLRRSSQRV